MTEEKQVPPTVCLLLLEQKEQLLVPMELKELLLLKLIRLEGLLVLMKEVLEP